MSLSCLSTAIVGIRRHIDNQLFEQCRHFVGERHVGRTYCVYRIFNGESTAREKRGSRNGSLAGINRPTANVGGAKLRVDHAKFRARHRQSC